MITDERLLQLIFNAIEEMNDQLPEDQQMEKSVMTPIFGETGMLDSLGLVNLIVAIEQKIEEECGVTLTIADEKAVSQKNSPFRTIGTIFSYIIQLLKEK